MYTYTYTYTFAYTYTHIYIILKMYSRIKKTYSLTEFLKKNPTNL